MFVILEGAGGQTMFYRGCEKIQDPKDHCEKTTVAQLGSASKCHCLGDGCNSASRLKSYFGIAFSILAIIVFRWNYPPSTNFENVRSGNLHTKVHLPTMIVNDKNAQCLVWNCIIMRLKLLEILEGVGTF